VPEPALHRPLKFALVGLLLAGVAMSLTAVVGAVTHDQTGQVWVFVAVAAALVAVAGLVLRGVRWVIVLCFVALAGQVGAVAGTVLELVFGVAEVKQRQLRALGFDPRAAIAVNLLYSAVGFGLFCWLAARWWAGRRA
jgi:hypothetical protein